MPVETVTLIPYPVLTDTPDVPRDIKALADRLEVLLGSGWSTYTPAWSCGSVAPSLGNGTLAGRYQVIGKTCHLAIQLAFGSTTTGGAGNWSFSYPSGVVPATGMPDALRGTTKVFVPYASGDLPLCTAQLLSTGVVPYAVYTRNDTIAFPVRNTDSSTGGNLSIPLATQPGESYAWAAGAVMSVFASFQIN